MKMKKLREYVLEAKRNQTAIGHFNISNIESLHAIFQAAKSLNVPVIIGVAEGERAWIGAKQAVALVKSLREEYQYPIFINADHTYSLEKVKEAIDDGYDAVIFDGTQLPYDANVSAARQCVEYARQANPDIMVEAELGFIGTSSKVWEAIPEGVSITEEYLTKPEEALAFVQATGIDLLAPAVGNIHGMLKGGKDPALNVERVKAIADVVSVPLVLHGASGNSDQDVAAAIKAGMAIVHVNTELRVAYREALEEGLAAKPDEVAPYKYMAGAESAVEAVVTAKLKVFNNLK